MAVRSKDKEGKQGEWRKYAPSRNATRRLPTDITRPHREEITCYTFILYVSQLGFRLVLDTTRRGS